MYVAAYNQRNTVLVAKGNWEVNNSGATSKPQWTGINLKN